MKRTNPYRPRRCKRCKLVFVPDKDKLDKYQAEAMKFCTGKCKDSYHRNGGMNIDRFHEVMERRLLKALLADDEFLDRLYDRLREKLGAVIRDAIWQELEGRPSDVRKPPHDLAASPELEKDSRPI